MKLGPEASRLVDQYSRVLQGMEPKAKRDQITTFVNDLHGSFTRSYHRKIRPFVPLFLQTALIVDGLFIQPPGIGRATLAMAGAINVLLYGAQVWRERGKLMEAREMISQIYFTLLSLEAEGVAMSSTVIVIKGAER